MPEKTKVIARAEWVLVGESSGDSLVVCGGPKPICIRVRGTNADVMRLLDDANAGFEARQKAPSP